MAIKRESVRVVKTVSKNRVAMVASKKLRLNPAILDYLEISKDCIGKNNGEFGVEIGFIDDEKLMTITRASKNNAITIGGSYETPELYCAENCQTILQMIGKTIARAGTVSFGTIKFDEYEDGEKVVTVALTDYVANENVFKD